MEIKMPDGAVLVTENPEVIDSYIKMMGGEEVTKKQTKSQQLRLPPPQKLSKERRCIL